MQVLLDTTGRAEDVADPRELTDADLEALYSPPPREWLRANMVSTVDGSATGDSGVSGSINNPADHRVFTTLRRLADAIVVGAGTARAESYRPAGIPIVVVSRRASVPTTLRGAPPGSVWLATCATSDGIDEARALLGEEHVLTLGSHRVDLPLLRATLVDRGWPHLLCEGGPHLLRDMVFQGAADELTATIVPRLLAGCHPRITHGAPLDAKLRLALLLEDRGTLLGRWLV